MAAAAAVESPTASVAGHRHRITVRTRQCRVPNSPWWRLVRNLMFGRCSRQLPRFKPHLFCLLPIPRQNTILMAPVTVTHPTERLRGGVDLVVEFAVGENGELIEIGFKPLGLFRNMHEPVLNSARH